MFPHSIARFPDKWRMNEALPVVVTGTNYCDPHREHYGSNKGGLPGLRIADLRIISVHYRLALVQFLTPSLLTSPDNAC